MYLDRVVLEHIRGFEKLDFKLMRPDKSYAGWTVFTGDNGSGKSTLLKAIAVGLAGRDTAIALQSNFNRWVREPGQQKRDDKPINQGTIRLDIMPWESDDRDDEGAPIQQPFTARLSLKQGNKETTLRAMSTKSKSGPVAPLDLTLWNPEPIGWFSCGYGPFRRITGNPYEMRQAMERPTTSRYITLFQESASLAGADTWLRELHFRSLERNSLMREQLTMLLNLLNADLLPNRMRIDSIDSDGVHLVDRNGVRLNWSDMSDGYRAILALLTDIFRHLIYAYTSSYPYEDYDHELRVLLQRSGVVLIDEIDAHLHPEWQREIGFWLKRHFPNIQFLVTTHSPIICQAADPNGLFVLPEPGSGEQPRALSEADYQRVITSRPDTILLTPAFGLQNTRSPEAVDARSEYARLAVKQRAGGELSQDEQQRLRELASFALNDEEL